MWKIAEDHWCLYTCQDDENHHAPWRSNYGFMDKLSQASSTLFTQPASKA
jgi:hypothetical protein